MQTSPERQHRDGTFLVLGLFVPQLMDCIFFFGGGKLEEHIMKYLKYLQEMVGTPAKKNLQQLPLFVCGGKKGTSR